MLHVNPKLFTPQLVDAHVKDTISDSKDQMLAILKTVPTGSAGGSGWELVGGTDEALQVYWAPASRAAKDVNGVMVASQWKLPQTVRPDALFRFLTQDPKGYRVIDPFANRHGERVSLPAADVPAHTTAHYTWAARDGLPMVFMVLNTVYDDDNDKLFISMPSELTTEQQKASKMPIVPKGWLTEAQNLWASYVHKIGNDWWLTSYCWLEFPYAGPVAKLPADVYAGITRSVDIVQINLTLQSFSGNLMKALGLVPATEPEHKDWVREELVKVLELLQSPSNGTPLPPGTTFFA